MIDLFCGSGGFLGGLYNCQKLWVILLPNSFWFKKTYIESPKFNNSFSIPKGKMNSATVSLMFFDSSFALD